MATKISDLQVRKAKFDSTRMTDRNHWSRNLALKPEVFELPNRYLFASRTNNLNLSQGNILEGIFGLGKTKYIDDLEWGWKVRAKGYRPLTILENRTVGSTPGKYRQPITILVDSNLAAIGETWGPGSSDKSQVAIVTNIKKEGTKGFEYTLETYTENSEHFINPKYLEAGQTWTRMFTMRGEAAESGGHTERVTDIEYRNSLVKLRKEYKVTDYGGQSVLAIALRTDDGRTFSSWMDLQQAEYEAAMNKELAIHALYSRIGDALITDPDSGYPIKPGAGLQQQIEFGGNVERYTTLSAELIEAFFDRIVYSRISPGDLGEVVGWSGHYGMKEFSKALDVWTGGKSIVREQGFISKDPKGVNNNSLRTGYQFTVYDLPNGGSFRLIHNPLNDDKEIHRDIDPLTGFPLESQRITILDVTGGNGQSINSKDNIRLVRKNHVKNTTIIEGRVGPGGRPAKNPAHSGDFYRVDISDSIGVEIQDPTVTGELIKSVN